MKKLFLMIAIVLSTVILASAQAPDSIRTSFEKNYPNTSATWKTENGYHNAYFTDDKNQQRIVSYDKNGRVFSNRTKISYVDAPPTISTYYREKYPTVKDYSIWMEDDGQGNQSYYTIQDRNRIFFDKSGNYTRTAPIDRSDPMYNFNDMKK